jgi:hypothetical protein
MSGWCTHVKRTVTTPPFMWKVHHSGIPGYYFAHTRAVRQHVLDRLIRSNNDWLVRTCESFDLQPGADLGMPHRQAQSPLRFHADDVQTNCGHATEEQS